MKSRRRWRWRWQHRGFALGLVLYTLLLLLLVSYMLDYGARRGRAGEELLPPRHCPSLEEALGDWTWGEQQEQRPPPEAAASHGGNKTGTGFEAGPGSRAGGKRHIYLHATWRTGSSFLGELFNQHPDVFYLYEPMWHMWQALYPGDALSLQGALRDMIRSLFRCDFSVLRLYAAPPAPRDPLAPFPAVSGGKSGSNLSTASIFGWRTNKVICSAPLCPDAPRARDEVGLVDGAACERSCPPRALRELEAECRKYPVMVIKDVRLLELGVLLPLLRDPELDLRIIQLFRDPRAVHNSRLKAKQALLRESIQVLRSRHRAEPRGLPRRQLLLPHAAAALAGAGVRAHQQHRAEFFLAGALEVICQAWLRDLLFSRGTPAWLRARYTQLRYEDLVLEPRAELRRLLRFVDLPTPLALEDFVLNMTRGAAYSSERPFLISARDAREAIHAWRERLSREQVRQVEDACGEAMSLLSYPLSGEEASPHEATRGRPNPPRHPVQQHLESHSTDKSINQQKNYTAYSYSFAP
ncbi:carbohydrate sulfotransferase 7 isoform X2 [Rhineura floridana]|uniref:carbohydrate sulfotransferase 7 isoform X2 n=1 Tax=Rhineura floridana TaxID=261503 RepID=UPI002AC87381|nr:carbohydrate sulfotransferase 7 isoform X2 [Rhineura floridana]